MLKNLNKLENKYIFFLCFLFPIIIVGYIIALKQSLNGNSIMVADMGRQYIGFFNNYKNIISGNASLFYSFSNGLGGSTLLDFYYYLGSPLNLILLFFSTKHLTIGILMIIIIKFGLTGLTMSIYLKHKFKISNLMIFLFSMCYALMSYSVHYWFNSMWLDALYIVPLVLIGIDKLIYDKKSNMYVILLSFNIITNYYIGYMCCLFYFIYFMWEILSNQVENKKGLFLKFILCSLYSVLLSAIVLLPILSNVDYASRPSDYMIPNSIKESLEGVLVIINQLFPFMSNIKNIEGSYLMKVYCGLFVFISSIFYFFNSRISKKHKLISGVVIILFLLSFTISSISCFWHGFSYPIGYHFRFSFLFSLFLIIICAKNYELFSINNKRLILIFFVIASIILFLAFRNYAFNLLIFSVLIMLLAIYLFIIINRKIFKKKIFEIMLVLLVMGELVINTYSGLIVSKEYNSGYNAEYDKSVDYCFKNDDYYRVNLTRRFTRNYALICDSHSTAYSSSNINNKVKKFYQKSGGYASGSYYYLDNQTTGLLKSLLGVKYEQTDKQKIITNDNALSIGYMIDNDKIDKNEKNAFEYQNNLISSMLGKDIKVLKGYELISKKDNKFIYRVDNDKYIYVTLWHDLSDYVYMCNILEIYVNDKKNAYMGSFVDKLGTIKIKNRFNDNVSFKLNEIKNNKCPSSQYDLNNLYVYYMDDEVYKEVIDELAKNQLKIDKMEKNYLTGTIDVDERKTLFLSIPYEEGWNIYVDGKKVDYFELYDTFIGVKLTKGHHKIEMKFYPKGFKLGFIISISSLLLLVVYTIFKRRWLKD